MNDETYRFSPDDIQRTRYLAWLSYLGILFLIPMLVYKGSPYTKFHVNQGIVFFILCIIVRVSLDILSIIPVVNWFSWILFLLYIPLLILMITGIVNAFQGRAKRLPVIGNIEIYK